MKLLNLFKKRPEIRNCFHPDFAPYIEKAFVGAGVHGPKTQYYKFKGDTELDMIAGRYNKSVKFMIEAQMRMDAQDLDYYLGKIEEEFVKDQIKLANVLKWVQIIRDRTKILIEDKTALRLASSTFFDEHEVLDTYDYDYNLKKIKAWEESGDYSFFFSSPISDLLPLPESWQKDSTQITNYLAQAKAEIEGRLSTIN